MAQTIEDRVFVYEILLQSLWECAEVCGEDMLVEKQALGTYHPAVVC